MSGSLTSSRLIVSNMTLALCAHITGGGVFVLRDIKKVRLIFYALILNRLKNVLASIVS